MIREREKKKFNRLTQEKKAIFIVFSIAIL